MFDWLLGWTMGVPNWFIIAVPITIAVSLWYHSQRKRKRKAVS